MLNFETFSRNYLVCGLTESQIAKICHLATSRTIGANETLIHEGEVSGKLFVVLSGRLNVLARDGDKLAEVGEGNVLGEIQLIDARPSSASVVAIGLVTVAQIPASELRQLMTADGQLGFLVLCNLARVLCMRLREADAKIDGLMDRVDHSVWTGAL